MISQDFIRGGLRLFCSLHGNDKDDIKQHKGGAPGMSGQRRRVCGRFNGLVPDFSRRVALESFLIAEWQMMRPL
jgi:hypothetical protein